MKKKVILLFMFLILLNFVNVGATEPSLGNFEQTTEIVVLQLCASCTYNNITSITSPNSTILVNNIEMLQSTQSPSEYNYSLSPDFTGEIGKYNVNGVGDINGVDTSWVFTFTITKTGSTFSTGKAVIYVLLTFAVFFLFLLSLYVTLTIPYSNQTNHQGAVIQVTRTKYIKIASVFLTHILFVWFLNVLIAVSDNFIELPLYHNFLGFIFGLLNRLALPLGIFLLVLMFFEIIRDANIQKAIKGFGGRG